MATGGYDVNGIWIYGEDDPASPFSDTLNLVAESTSVEIATDRSRLSSIEDTLATVRDRPIFRGYKAGDNSVPGDGTERGPGTVTVDFSEGGSWGASIHSSIREVPTAGFYRITAVGRFGAIANNGVLQMTIRKNSTSSTEPDGELIATTLSTTRGDGRPTTVIVTCIHEMANGDSFQMGVLQNSGVDLDWVGAQPYGSYIEAEFIRGLAISVGG